MISANPDSLRKELAEAEARGDIPKCIEICRHALTDESILDPDLLHFGIKLAAFLIAYHESASERDVDEAIGVLKRLLTVMSRQKKPRAWGRLHLQIGAAIVQRKGDINEAIEHYEKALEVLTKEKDPKEWAVAKKAAGEAYYLLADSISDLCKSLTYYREALTIFTIEKYPDEGLVEAINMIETLVSKAKALENRNRGQS